MLWCAGLLVAGAVLAVTTVRRPAPDCRRPECRVHGSVAVPPLEPRTGAGALREDGRGPR